MTIKRTRSLLAFTLSCSVLLAGCLDSSSNNPSASNPNNVTNDNAPAGETNAEARSAIAISQSSEDAEGVRFTIAGQGDAGKRVNVLANEDQILDATLEEDGDFSLLTDPVNTDATVTLTARILDSAGNVIDSEEVMVDVDTYAFAPIFEGNTLTNNTTPQFGFRVVEQMNVALELNDLEIGTYDVAEGGTQAVNVADFLDNTTLADGTYTLNAQVTDANGNTATLELTEITIDSVVTAPTVNLPSQTNESTPAITVQSDNDARITVYADGVLVGDQATDNAGQASFNLTALADGTYNVEVRATDPANNIESVAQSLRIDTSAPELLSASITDGDMSFSADLSGTSELQFVFDETLKAATVSNSSVVLTDDAGNVDVTVSHTDDQIDLQTSYNKLHANSDHLLTFTTAISDDLDNTIAQEDFVFRTKDVELREGQLMIEPVNIPSDMRFQTEQVDNEYLKVDDAGRMSTVFFEDRNNKIVYTQYDPADGSYQSHVIDINAWREFNFDVSGDGDVAIAYAPYTGEIMLEYFDADAQTWTNVEVFNDPDSARDAQVHISAAGVATLLWRSGENSIKTRMYDPQSGLTPIVEVVNLISEGLTATLENPNLAKDETGFAAVTYWVSDSNSSALLEIFVQQTDASGNWSSYTRLPSIAGEISRDVVLDVAGGHGVLAYIQRITPDQYLVAARYAAGSNTWVTSTTVSGRYGVASEREYAPHVDINTSGDGIIVASVQNGAATFRPEVHLMNAVTGFNTRASELLMSPAGTGVIGASANIDERGNAAIAYQVYSASYLARFDAKTDTVSAPQLFTTETDFQSNYTILSPTNKFGEFAVAFASSRTSSRGVPVAFPVSINENSVLSNDLSVITAP